MQLSTAPLQADDNEMDCLYAALVCLLDLVNCSDYQIRFPLQEVDVIMFYNRRVLHGRSEFSPKTGDRALRGTYVERDDVMSKIREFEQQQSRNG
mgnify:CR=1 FL=1